MHNKWISLILLGASLSIGGSLDTDSSSLAFRTPVDVKENVSILLGYNGVSNHFLEIGIARNKYGRYGHHAAGKAVYLALEVSPDGSVFGGKIGKWYSGMGFTFAGNALAYLEGNRLNVGIRPEFGIGFGNFKIDYGVNLLAPDFFSEKNNLHVFNVSVAIGVFTLRKIKDWGEEGKP